MLKIRRSSNGQVVYTLSGRINREHLTELETLLRSEANGQPMVLDLTDVTLVDQDGVAFLEHCEGSGITLKNCPAYIREWITRQRSGS
jgi:anti-anti-sigma regulatory factor